MCIMSILHSMLARDNFTVYKLHRIESHLLCIQRYNNEKLIIFKKKIGTNLKPSQINT